MNRQFTKEDISMANKHMERYPTYVTRESRVKTRYQNKIQGYIVQHREYSQYFKITINGV